MILTEAFVFAGIALIGRQQVLLTVVLEYGDSVWLKQAKNGPITNVVRSTRARALFSCRLTQAVCESAEIATNSGSRSSATVACWSS